MTRDVARRLREADELLKFGDDLDSIGDLLSEAASLIERDSEALQEARDLLADLQWAGRGAWYYEVLAKIDAALSASPAKDKP
jgi:hypothetical protein